MAGGIYGSDSALGRHRTQRLGLRNLQGPTRYHRLLWSNWACCMAVRSLAKLGPMIAFQLRRGACRRPRGFTGRTALRSTESRPVETYRGGKRGDFVGFPASGETITSSISRRIPTGIAGLEGVGSPSNLRSYTWARRRSRWPDPVSCAETKGCELLIRS
jgi:hypothetical protein